ncbi:hypothetical protein [Endozoicomonas numazuensis]|uniref:Uncharacterized protein n=1 Tax=Endozoicomonas numazuensis TaxID=1137799 RepID=A0A081NEW4_9GAMM|nr:hypothetical protein [Endozoicomonas numazuensis]KEQ16987.1 hypothetical protein GZ78_20415 [Endozoicomonas numazuensis]
MDIPREDSVTSQDSGFGSLKKKSPESTGRSFNKQIHAFSPDKKTEESPEAKQASVSSYKSLGERDIQGFYRATEVGTGWPEETKKLYEKGQKIVRMLQRFTTLLADYNSSDRPDNALHAMSVMVGKPSVKGDSARLLEERESLHKQLAVIDCKEEWLKAEKAAKETLDMISACTSLYPYSKEDLNASNEALETLNSDTLMILNRVSQGKGKYKPNSREKALIKRQRQESARNKELQKNYDDVLAQRLTLLEPSLKKLNSHTSEISQKYQAEFSPCLEAARSDVRLVDAKGRARGLETEKVSSELLLASGSVGTLLEYFAKKYFEFQANGGKQSIQKPRTEEEIAAVAAKVEANRYPYSPVQDSKDTPPPLSHQDSGIADPDNPDLYH